MRVSKIEARRVFTRYGWQPINSDAFANSAGKQIITLDNEDYRMRIFESAGKKKIKWYAQVTDRRCNERYYLSAYLDKLRFENMKQELNLTTEL